MSHSADRIHLARVLALLFATACPAIAIEKDGLLVDVQETVNDRKDGGPSYFREINRDMSLRADVTNRGLKDLPAGEVDYVILIERWLTEKSKYDRYRGTVKIGALPRSKNERLILGAFHLGGHLHGSSRMHVDDVAGWKLTFKYPDKSVVVTNKSNFDSMNARATDAAK